jgi:hypothetical protein
MQTTMFGAIQPENLLFFVRAQRNWNSTPPRQL